MYERNDIILAVDYHDNNIVVRWLNCYTGEERVLTRSTAVRPICQLIDNAVSQAAAKNLERMEALNSIDKDTGRIGITIYHLDLTRQGAGRRSISRYIRNCARSKPRNPFRNRAMARKLP